MRWKWFFICGRKEEKGECVGVCVRVCACVCGAGVDAAWGERLSSNQQLRQANTSHVAATHEFRRLVYSRFMFSKPLRIRSYLCEHQGEDMLANSSYHATGFTDD